LGPFFLGFKILPRFSKDLNWKGPCPSVCQSQPSFKPRIIYFWLEMTSNQCSKIFTWETMSPPESGGNSDQL